MAAPSPAQASSRPPHPARGRWSPSTAGQSLAVAIATAIVALSWFIALRTGVVRRGALWLITALAVLTVVLDFAVGIAYTGPVEFGTITLPWGETVSHVSGATNPLRVVGDAVLIGFLLVLLDVTVRMVRRGERRLVGHGVGGDVVAAPDLGR